jgi:hypothetical protein
MPCVTKALIVARPAGLSAADQKETPWLRLS